MIINQDFTISNGNRPVRNENSGNRTHNKGGAAGQPTSIKETADTVSLDSKRLTINENLQASELSINDQTSAGELMNMLKEQLGQNPAAALEAQTDKLEAIAARLLGQ